jgi:outer membrane protein OmpA-like peptidoglycan-associated protein
MKNIIKSKKLIVSIATISLLSGCADKSIYDNASNTQKGAGIGALAGAVIGAVSSKHHKGKNAAIGAAIGGAIGGGIGYNMDQQAQEIAQVLQTDVDSSPNAEMNQDKDIIVTKNDRFVKVTFRDKMMFATNSANLTPTARSKVNKVVDVLRNYPTTVIQVVGHTDNRGSHSYNATLSKRRAASVGSIIMNGGITNPVYKRGCSFDKPIVPNTNKKNMNLNRRVEIFLYPNRELVVDQCI